MEETDVRTMMDLMYLCAYCGSICAMMRAYRGLNVADVVGHTVTVMSSLSACGGLVVNRSDGDIS